MGHELLTLGVRRGGGARVACTLTSAAADPVYTTFEVTITFARDVTGFVEGDITVVNATLSNFAAVSGSVYTVDVTPTASGAVTLSVAAGVTTPANAASNVLTREYVIDIDFSTLADGPLPLPLVGATWAVSSGAAVNTLTPGSNLLTDPGLEANYTAGKCDTLTKAGTPTLVEETSDIHGGSKAQAFTGVAQNDSVRWPIASAPAKRWLRATLWNKRIAGTGSDSRFYVYHQGNGSEQNALVGATWVRTGITIYSPSAANLFVYPANEQGTSDFNTVLVDDGFVDALTTSELFATLPSTQANVVIKSRWVFDNVGACGNVARLDSVANPQSYIVAYYAPSFRLAQGYAIHIRLDKFIAGARTNLIDSVATGAAVSSADDFELRCSGTGVSVWFRNAQVGTTKTISDTELVSNTLYGAFAAGGSQLVRFFVQGS